jgi:ABC-type dipeptide/oligopeptide/nickel transport system permease component
MSTAAFMAAYLAGAALLAMWVDLRYPNIRPSGWGRLGISVAATLAVNDVCGALLTAGPRLFSVMGLALPAITLTFLVCIWLLRMMRAAMPA